MSFSLQLSSGWIKDLHQNNLNQNNNLNSAAENMNRQPILQITDLSIMPLNAAAAPGHSHLQCCLLSDGRYSSWALLHPSYKAQIGSLKFSVIKLLEYTLLNLPSTGRTVAIKRYEFIAVFPSVIGQSRLWSKETKNETPQNSSAVPNPWQPQCIQTCSLTQDFSMIYGSFNFSDLVLMVAGQKFYVHKVVLCARSSYFKALLTNGMRETHLPSSTQQLVQEIPLAFPEDAETFGVILKWIYTDEITFPPILQMEKLEESLLWKLWKASSYFCLPSLTQAIEQHIMSIITVENVCYFWNYVHHLESAHSLEEFCRQFFCNNLHLLVNCSNFISLDRKLLLDIFFTNQESNRDASGLATHFSLESLPYRTLALTCWCSSHYNDKTKRKLEECFPAKSTNTSTTTTGVKNITSAKRKRISSPSQSTAGAPTMTAAEDNVF